MITFWLLSVGLVAVIVFAVLFVLPPWLRKAQKKSPLVPARGVLGILQGRAVALSVAIAIPLLATLLYFNWPANLSDVLQDGSPSVAKPPATQGEKMAPEHAQLVDDMAARLEQNPNDGRGWAVLAQSYAVMGRYADAVIAYEKAARLTPNDAQLLVDYADVMAVANDRSLSGKPVDLVRKALKIDPNNVKGLALIGTAAFQQDNYAGAVKYWEKALRLLPPESPFAKQMKSGIAEARTMLASKPTAANQANAAAGGAQISGIVTLSPALADKVSPTDSVFVSAKSASGSPMPLAVMRAQVKDLPLKFTLDDSMAIAPTMKLSDHKIVTVNAKVSKLGEAMSQPGDMKGELRQVKVGTKDLQIVINKIVPE